MNDRSAKVVVCVFLIVTTFSVYSQVLDHEFINFDDDKYVTENSIVQVGLTNENIIRIFTEPIFGMWIPITTLSYIIDYEVYGLNAKGYLLTNLLFHIANSLLLFLVLFRITGAIWKSAFVAAMFAFHPLNVESVAWISERKNVLSTLFWLLTMWTYINYAESPNVKRYGIVVLFFTLGLMSKAMLVTLPFVLLLLDYWPLKRLKLRQEKCSEEVLENNTAKSSEIFRLVQEKIPLFLITMVSSILTVVSQHRTFGVQFSESISMETRLNNAMVSYLEYLRKMIWPENLSMFYPHPGNTLSTWQGILCGMAFVSITIFSIRLIRKVPYFAVGWFWYVGTLIPVIGVVQVGGQAMADRYAYIPLIGVFILLSWGVPELISKWRFKGNVLSISAAIIIPILLVTTWGQVNHWKDSITLFKHTIEVTDKKYPNLAIIHNNLGIALFAGGKNEEAISHYMKAINLKSNHTLAHYNLGIALFADGKAEKAISHYNMAIKLNPDFTNAHYNLGIVLVQKGEMKKAVHHFRETLKLKPDLVVARDSLELALLKSQEFD
jgi:tetratricopeptide (TPR) repeat protein